MNTFKVGDKVGYTSQLDNKKTDHVIEYVRLSGKSEPLFKLSDKGFLVSIEGLTPLEIHAPLYASLAMLCSEQEQYKISSRLDMSNQTLIRDLTINQLIAVYFCLDDANEHTNKIIAAYAIEVLTLRALNKSLSI